MGITKHLATGTLAIALSLASTSANAGRASPSGWYETTTFVAETKMPGLSLCHLIKKHHVAYLSYSFESLGYVLAEDNCKAESFYPVDAAQLREMQTGGLIHQNIPVRPALDLKLKLQGYLLYVVLGFLAIVGLVSKLGGSTGIGGPRKRRASKQTDTRMLAVMCQVAKCDGQIEAGEIATIAAAIKRLTGNDIPVNQIAQIIDTTDLRRDLPQLSALGDGLNANDRINLLEAALTVAVSDGSIASEEYAFIQDLSHALQIKADDFRVSLRRIAGSLSPQMV